MILEGRQIGFAYRRSQPVLADVDIRIAPGLTALVGPNAAGKSTLLRCLCGLLAPTGQVLLDGQPARRLSRAQRARQISYLPQDLTTSAVLTVFEAVLLGRLHQLGWSVERADTDAVAGLLAELGLADLAGRYVNELSGGQLQMVAIAQALAREPNILLMDEPTSNLDLRHQWEICALLRRLAGERDMSVALAMHDLNLAARFADTVCLLHGGRVVAAGPPAEVLTETAVRDVYRVAVRITCDAGRPAITPIGLADGDS